MGNTYPGEYYGATCCECRTSLPPLLWWDGLTQQYIDRLVTSGEVYVFHGGQYYRPLDGGHLCPTCFWRPKKTEEERRERERKQSEEQRRAEEERQKLKRQQEEQARQDAIRIENERIENEKKRLNEIRLRDEAEKQLREKAVREEQERREQLRIELAHQEAIQKQRELQIQKELEEEGEWNLAFGRTAQQRQSLMGGIRQVNSRQLQSEVLKESFREEKTIGKIEKNQGLKKFRKGVLTKMLEMRIAKLAEDQPIDDKQLLQKLLGALDGDLFSNDTKSLCAFLSLLLQRYIEIACRTAAEGMLLRDCLENIVSVIPDDELKPLTETLCVISLNINNSKINEDLMKMSNVVQAVLQSKSKMRDDVSDIGNVVQIFLNSMINQGTIKQPNFTWISRCIFLSAQRVVGDNCAAICVDLVENDIWSYDELQRCFKQISNFNLHSYVELENILTQIKRHRVTAVSFLQVADTSSQSWKALEMNLTKVVRDEPERSFESILDEITLTKMIDGDHLSLVVKAVKLTIEKLASVGLHVGLKNLSLDYEKLLTNRDSIKNAMRDIRSQVMNSVTLGLIADALAIVCSAVYKSKGYCPRLTQILTCSLLMISNQYKINRLLEINTGEGKSCIIAMFAAILGMQGKKIDILTSSPLLARRDAAEWDKFYSEFGLTSSCNTSETVTPDTEDKVSKATYQKNIVYGTVGSFAADILRDEFQMKDIRGTRGFQNVIVDEVDLMMLDHGVQLTYLSHRAAGMRHIEPVIATIWLTVSQYSSVSTGDGDCWFCGVPKFFVDTVFDSIDSKECGIESPLQLLQSAEDDNLVESGFCQKLKDCKTEQAKEIIKCFTSDSVCEIVKNVQNYIPYSFIIYKLNNNNQLIKHEGKEQANERIQVPILILKDGLACPMYTEEDTKFGIIESVESKFKFSSNSAGDSKEQIVLPTFLESYVHKQIPVYVDSALTACNMFENRHYILGENEILPIDFASSGVVEKNKKWGQGLQQFLEMKHGRKLSTLSIVTNFMSNIEFFTRYNRFNGSIFGLSGTVGTDSDIHFLQTQYELQVCKIPTHRRRKIVEDQLLQINQNQEEWILSICSTVEKQIQTRTALIICEDIKTAMKVTEKIKDLVTKRVTTYVRSDLAEVDLMVREFEPGEVIVATTLAGRGTDISVSDKVTQAGGIYVLVTFLPQNRRVELQAFGRTGRKGNPGSVQLVLHAASIPSEYQFKNLKNIREKRALKEKQKLEMMLKTDVNEVYTRTQLFDQYCTTLREIHEQIKGRPDKEVILDALHETWGQWLQMNTNKQTPKSELQKQLADELIAAKDKVLNSISPIDNFYHIIKYANKLADSDTSGAIRTYTQVIQSAERWSVIAYYNRAYCQIKETKADYMKKAEDDLNQAKSLLKNYLEETTCVQQLVTMSLRKSMKEEEIQESNFSEHISTRQQVLSFWNRNIDEAIAKLQELSKEKEDAEVCAKGVFSLAPDNHYAMNMEILELHGLGMEIVFSVKKKPKFCWDAFAVFCLGILQVIAGAALMVFTAGILSTIGAGLISEGISDMIQGIEGMIKGEFSWKDWGIGKGISIAISIVCGFGKMIIKHGKMAFKELKTAFTKCYDQLKGIPKMITGGFTEATKSNLKHVAALVVKEVAIEGVMKVVELGDKLVVDAILDEMARKIEKNAKQFIKEEFDRNGSISELVDRIILSQLPRYAIKNDDIPPKLHIDTTEIFKIFAVKAMQPQADEKEVLGKILGYLHTIKDGLMEHINMNRIAKITAHAAEFTASAAITANIVSEVYNLQVPFLKQMCTFGNDWCSENELAELGSLHELKDKNLDCVKKFKVHLTNELAKNFREIIKEMLDNGLSGLLMRAKSKLINQPFKNIGNKYLKRNETLERIKAGQDENYPTAVKPPIGETGSMLSLEDIKEEMAEDISSGSSSGSILEARIAAEINHQDIVIVTSDSSGEEKLITRISSGSQKSENEIKLMYSPPSGSNSEGHFIAIDNGEIIRKSSSLYDAVAQATHPNDDVTSLQKHEKELRALVSREITASNGKWTRQVDISIQLNQFNSNGNEIARSHTNTKRTAAPEKKDTSLNVREFKVTDDNSSFWKLCEFSVAKQNSSDLNLQEFAVHGSERRGSDWNPRAREMIYHVLDRKQMEAGDRRNTL